MSIVRLWFQLSADERARVEAAEQALAAREPLDPKADFSGPWRPLKFALDQLDSLPWVTSLRPSIDPLPPISGTITIPLDHKAEPSTLDVVITAHLLDS
jgi:hypothetical protein